DTDVADREPAGYFVAASAVPGDIQPRMAGGAEGCSLRVLVSPDGKTLRGRRGYVQRERLPERSSAHADRHIVRLARDRHGPVPRVEQLGEVPADVVTAADHGYERGRDRRRRCRPGGYRKASGYEGDHRGHARTKDDETRLPRHSMTPRCP